MEVRLEKITMAEKLIKSKERVQKFAEVYTPAHIVKDMCDLIPETLWDNIERRFLDKTTPRLIQFHTLKNAVNPPFLGGFLISGTVAA